MTTEETIMFKSLNLQISQLLVEFESLKQSVHEKSAPLEQKELSEWLTLDECCSLKYGPQASKKTLQNKPDLMPMCGIRTSQSRTFVAGKIRFHRDIVIPWLSVTDDMIPEYKKTCLEIFRNQQIIARTA